MMENSTKIQEFLRFQEFLKFAIMIRIMECNEYKALFKVKLCIIEIKCTRFDKFSFYDIKLTKNSNTGTCWMENSPKL